MKLSPNHLKRYKEIAQLFWKYGRSDLVKQMGIDEAVDPQQLRPASDGEATPDQLADDLEAMGPTYVKLGQVLSGRPDLLPESYLKASRAFKQGQTTFLRRWKKSSRWLGVRISKAFSLRPCPIAAASLGQVHSAALRDGRWSSKVQRPTSQTNRGRFRSARADRGILDSHTNWAAGTVFTLEGSASPFSGKFTNGSYPIALGQPAEFERSGAPTVPTTAPAVSTRWIMSGPEDHRAGSARPSGNERRTAGRGTVQGVFETGAGGWLFHADPHPGNVFLTDASHIALLDLGMVGHTTPVMQENLLKLLAIGEERRPSADT
jgi:predicted unusual protein kinase regulating ubiquinone biosynthesis (AarF/ABC1/UbiB family)